MYKIEGCSMEPSYKSGDRVIITRLIKPKTGDVIVFKKNAMTMIKRVQKIENQKYHVRGDNWNESEGSDEFGAIEKEAIIGKVILKY